ncbi:MAG: glutamate-1-semialdehyde 2,1-aminomutase [Deltaproteobacteria bacterium]|nr:glutamate-1-semialdehyde 2,1-aminomutase [Deltaproteobacteria bacterium]
MKNQKSVKAFEVSQQFFPGGVNSPVRAFRAVGGTPPFISRAKGSKLWDIDGNEYIDYIGAWGPAILGHAHPDVTNVIRHAAESGTSYGVPTEMETMLAKLVAEAFPSMEMMRFVNSGTEATMSALRVARGFTKRSKIIKFEGCYHGHADGLLVKAGSGAATFGEPTSAGVSKETAAETIVCSYNHLEEVEAVLAKVGKEVAAIIVEPVAGNMGCVPPAPGFLEGLRKLTKDHGSLLIFDEVMTGFRVSHGGAQQLYGIAPDLTCLGKIIGGGLPVGAYGGRREIMQLVSPLGPVYQAGTNSGNPLSMAAGIETLTHLKHPGVYESLETRTKQLTDGIHAILHDAKIPHTLNRLGSMWTVFFTDHPVTDFASASTADVDRFKRFFQAMFANGILLPPSPFESAFVSLAHSDEEVNATIEAAKKWAQSE